MFKCRCETYTANITTAAFKNGNTCGKTKTQFVKRVADGGSFSNTLVNKLPFEMHLPDITLLARERIESGWNAQGVEYTNK